MSKKPTPAQIKKLRSRAWFDNPDNIDMTALYLERYMNFGLTREELQKLDRGVAAARRIIERAGGKYILTSRMRAIQMGGTIRLKEHLDEGLQTEIRNLHVCDGSVIPQSVKVPPTVTLVCLGKFLANHLSRAL